MWLDRAVGGGGDLPGQAGQLQPFPAAAPTCRPEILIVVMTYAPVRPVRCGRTGAAPSSFTRA
jgi:hypothetical protein